MKKFLLFSTSVLFCSSIFAVSTKGLHELRSNAINKNHTQKLVVSPKSQCSFGFACAGGGNSITADCNTSYELISIASKAVCARHGGMAKCK